MSSPILYLIPTNLAEAVPADAFLPAQVRSVVHRLEDFVVEDAKMARAFLKLCGTAQPLQALRLSTLNEHTPESEVEALLAPLQAGRDLGLLSDAGAPAVADPGALLVAAAHRAGFTVMPMVGPSSLLLALMASGLNGQRFAFQGYLPQERGARIQSLQALEKESAQKGMTQLFIETPYRNQAMFADLVATCRPATRIAVAADLTGANQFIGSKSAQDWKRQPLPELGKRPTVFLLLA
jgi:16S rRNA (cytidine1402-2'-O)-methyltransferase